MIRRARVGAAGNQTVMLCGLNAPAAGLGDGVTVAPSGMPGGHAPFGTVCGSAFWHRVCRRIPNHTNKLEFFYSGPYRVQKVLSNSRYKLRDLENYHHHYPKSQHNTHTTLFS
eukprot:scaffold9107_cov112-Isochrysis_galbana.AAC.1